VRKLLEYSRRLTYVAVAISLLSAVLIHSLAVVNVVRIVVEAFSQEIAQWEASRRAAVGLLKVWDLLLIGAGFQITASGLYKLYIHPESDLAPQEIESMDDLKSMLSGLAIVVLLIMFLEQALALGPGRELLEFGLAVAAVILAAGWVHSKHHDR